MVTNNKRRVPRTFQQLNKIFNMGQFKGETGKNRVEPDAVLEQLNEQKKKKVKKPRIKL